MEAVFLRVLNMSITATWAALAVFVLRWLLKRKTPKWISYALWAIVLFRLVCPVSFSSAFSLLGSIGAPGANSEAVSYIPADIATSESAQMDAMIPGVGESINSALSRVTPDSDTNPIKKWILIGAYIWVAGVLVMLSYSVLSYIRLKRRICDATLVEENIFHTDAIDSPFVCGIFHPRIYLPMGLDESEQRYVLMHEQTHIRRRDYIVKPLSFLAMSIHWFNPVIWLSFRMMSLDMEMSCDERVIREFNRDEIANYGVALLHLKTGHQILAGSPLAFGEDGAESRVRNLLNYRKPAFWVSIVAVIAAAAAAVYLLGNPGSTYRLRSLRKNAEYRNGLYLVTEKIENDEASAVFDNDLFYKDGYVKGTILITDNMEYEYSEDQAASDDLRAALDAKYVFTRRIGKTEQSLGIHGSSLHAGTVDPIIFGKRFREYLSAGDEDTLVSIFITGFEAPLQFIIPKEGTAPEWGMIYGTFTPCEIVYLSPKYAQDSAELLESAKEAVFFLSEELFSVSDEGGSGLIGEAIFENPIIDGNALGDTLEVVYRFGSDERPESENETIDISGYVSKMHYRVKKIDYTMEISYGIFLMDDQTWIGRWSIDSTEKEVAIYCDYIFRVTPAA